MWVLVSTESMQSALLCSMKPIPPMSAASWYTSPAPAQTRRHSSRSLRSATTFSTSSNDLVPLVQRLDVHGADLAALGPERRDQVAADEAAGAGHDDQRISHETPTESTRPFPGAPVGAAKYPPRFRLQSSRSKLANHPPFHHVAEPPAQLRLAQPAGHQRPGPPSLLPASSAPAWSGRSAAAPARPRPRRRGTPASRCRARRISSPTWTPLGTQQQDGPAYRQRTVDLGGVHDADDGVAHRHQVHVRRGEREPELVERLVGQRSDRSARRLVHLALADPAADEQEHAARADRSPRCAAWSTVVIGLEGPWLPLYMTTQLAVRGRARRRNGLLLVRGSPRGGPRGARAG